MPLPTRPAGRAVLLHNSVISISQRNFNRVKETPETNVGGAWEATKLFILCGAGIWINPIIQSGSSPSVMPSNHMRKFPIASE